MIASPVVHVVDDDPAITRLVAELGEAIRLDVRSYSSADEFLDSYKGTGPGCLVLDVRVPGTSGLELQRHLLDAGSTLPIIFITAYADVRMAVEAMERGAFGFLEKPFRVQELCEKIQAAIRQDVAAWRERENRENAARRLAQLTPAERRVAERIAHGETNRMIGQALGVSTRTVEAQRAKLMDKLGIRSRTELVQLMASARGGFPGGA